jgi:coproporphyrinogen III oxidase
MHLNAAPPPPPHPLRSLQYGLDNGARVESVFMSMPLTARWEYMHPIAPGSEEEKLMAVLTKPAEWCDSE